MLILRRSEVKPFTDRQIRVLKTFAEQAVIAIENTRLFEQVQARTREASERSTELTRALEQQTATSDVLSIISRSPTNAQPVFDTIARNAARLCKAKLFAGNAIKFTDAGEVRITAGAANGHFAVSVSDTGPGIPPEECERIFQKFQQIDSSNTRAKGGTGLGLAIAREIVEMHGGRIWVESMIGQGSTFRMELPVHAGAGAA